MSFPCVVRDLPSSLTGSRVAFVLVGQTKSQADFDAAMRSIEQAADRAGGPGHLARCEGPDLQSVSGLHFLAFLRGKFPFISFNHQRRVPFLPCGFLGMGFCKIRYPKQSGHVFLQGHWRSPDSPRDTAVCSLFWVVCVLSERQMPPNHLGFAIERRRVCY